VLKESADHDNGGNRVLVLDDEPALSVGELRLYEHTVIEAQTGNEATPLHDGSARSGDPRSGVA
jgi:hypothetical protein